MHSIRLARYIIPQCTVVFTRVVEFSPYKRKHWSDLPKTGVQEIYTCVTKAIKAAKRYIYIEDQYLSEKLGGKPEYEIYPYLMEAAKRGVKVILVGSSKYAPDNEKLFGKDINRTVNADIQKKVLDPLPPAAQRNVVLYRVEHTTVHAKIIGIDGEFVQGQTKADQLPGTGVTRQGNMKMMCSHITRTRLQRVKKYDHRLAR